MSEINFSHPAFRTAFKLHLNAIDVITGRQVGTYATLFIFLGGPHFEVKRLQDHSPDLETGWCLDPREVANQEPDWRILKFISDWHADPTKSPLGIKVSDELLTWVVECEIAERVRIKRSNALGEHIEAYGILK